MHPEPNPSSQPPRLRFAQWLGLVGPPLIWLLQFEWRYALAGRGASATIKVIAVAALLLVAACALVGFRQWRLAHASPLDRWAGTGDRARFMAALGLLNSGLFFLVIVAQLLAEFFIPPGQS